MTRILAPSCRRASDRRAPWPCGCDGRETGPAGREVAVRAAVVRAEDPQALALFDADEAAHGRSVTEGTALFVWWVAPAQKRKT